MSKITQIPSKGTPGEGTVLHNLQPGKDKRKSTDLP